MAVTLTTTVPQAAGASVVRVSSDNSGWHLTVNGSSYMVRGMNYVPTTVGQDPGTGNYEDFWIDYGADGRPKSPYHSWVDLDHNDHQDKNEPAVGDFALMKAMGVNTIRIYHHQTTDSLLQTCNTTVSAQTALQFNHAQNVTALRDLYNTYGIMTAMGDNVGAYVNGNCVSFSSGTDYTDAAQLSSMTYSVRTMVNEFKDEPWLLMWILGNENNYSWTSTNAETESVAYYQFLNSLAAMIKTLDPNHPVAIANGEILFLSTMTVQSNNVDIFGLNSYRGPDTFTGFGTLWTDVSTVWNRPVLLTEYGNGALTYWTASGCGGGGGCIDEDWESRTALSYACDIEAHRAGRLEPQNAIGGFYFQWMDAWWNGSTGVCSQGAGNLSPYQRQLKRVWWTLQAIWTGAIKC